jgi:hypothetical protein
MRNKSMMILAAEILVIIVALLLIGNHYAAAQELPLYPKEDLDRLDYYDYGVEKTIETSEFVFKYENIYLASKEVKTKGTITIAPVPNAILRSLKVQYVITNKDHRIVKTVVLLDTTESSDTYRFSVKYDFRGEYELGAIHIFVVEEVRVGNPVSEGEKLNV